MNAPGISWPERITLDPDICNGRPTIRGTRIAVQTVLDFLGAGDSPEDVLCEYPSLEIEDIRACLLAAASVMKHQYAIRQSA